MYQRIFTILLLSAVTNDGLCQNVGIGITQPTHKLHVTDQVSTSNGAVVYAYNTGTSGNALYGVSNSAGTYGIQGLSTAGTGVYGYTNSFRAVAGSTITGTALWGYSITGYGLEVAGKVKISGGNTSPSKGAVLTSDESGNAVWKPKRVGFKASEIADNAIQDGSRRKVTFASKSFDYNSNFTAASTFVAPVAGLYHFDVRLKLRTVILERFEDTEMTIMRNRNGSIATLATVLGTSGFEQSATIDTRDDAIYNLNTNEQLLEGDIIWVEIFQKSGDVGYLSTGPGALFSGFLVFAD